MWTDNNNNRRIDQEVHVIYDLEEINHKVTTESEYYSQHYQNFFRKQIYFLTYF